MDQMKFLLSGQNGFLFESNNLSDFLKKFDEFKNLTEEELSKKKILCKKTNKSVYSICSF